MNRLNLVLFGGFGATIGARTVAVPLKKARALLALLALSPGQRLARERLSALLWGDAADEQARNSLRQALFAIRNALGQSSRRYLGGDPSTVWLEPGAVDVDVLAFERFIANDTNDALAKAASLYHGDLLDGVGVEAGAFDEWLIPTRQRLQRAATRAMAKLLGRQIDAGAVEAAIATSTKLLSIDPLQEIAHRALIGLYAGTGRRTEAIRQYRACVDLLRRELQTEPEPATMRAYRTLFREESGRSAPAAPPVVERRRATDRAPFVGRDAELTALAHHLRLATAGSGRVVAVLGEAGVGKTRLTEELIARVPPDGVLHLRGRSYESSGALPLALWAEALQPQAAGSIRELQSLGHFWARNLETLFPDLGRPRARSARGGDRLRLFEALAHFVRWLAAGRTVLVVLEDLHWADDMSLRLLAFLGRRLAAWPVLVVATARVEELAECGVATFGELARERRLHQLPLGPLSIDDTAALVRSLVAPGIAAPDLAGLLAHVWRVSEGNPFVTTETMRTVQPGRVPPWESGAALPETVRAMTRSRLQRLNDPARRLMAIAAVVGREFDFALLHRASGSDELATAEAVEELVRAHLLRERADRFEIVHDRVRQVVAEDLLPARRRALHVAVARALEALHHDRLEDHSADLARHHHAAGIWDKAVTYLRMAGAQAASRGAYREAVSFFERALVDLARLPRSRQTLELAVDLRFDLRDWLMPLGELSRLAVYVREAAELASDLKDERRTGLAVGHLAHHHQSTGEPGRALVAGQQSAEIAARLGDLTLVVLANFNLGEAHHLLGNHHAAAEFLRRNVALVSGDGVYERYAGPGLVPLQSRFWLAFSLAELGEYREAMEIAIEAARAAQAVQHPYSQAFAEYAIGRLHLSRGAVNDALEALERAWELVDSREIVLIRPHVGAWLGSARALTGRSTEGIRLIRESQAQAERMGRSGRGSISTRLAEALLADGRLSDALGAAEQAIELTRQQHERGHEAAALRALADVHAELAESSVEAVGRRYAEARELASALCMRPVVAGCHLGLGRFHRRLGQTELAEAQQAMAARLFVEMGIKSPSATARP